MTSPNTQITEVDKSYYIPHETNEIGMFVGHFERGPIDLPIYITNINQFKFLFGRGIDVYHQDWYQVYNYLQYSSGLWVCNSAGYKKSNANNSSEIVINTYEDWKTTYNTLSVNTIDSVRILARTPGIWGNLIKVAIIDKTEWDNNSILYNTVKTKDVFEFFEYNYIGICVFRGNNLVENFYIDMSTIKNIEDINTQSNYIYIKAKDTAIISELVHFNNTIIQLSTGFSSFPTALDLDRAYDLFKEDYSIDIIIGNEKNNVPAIKLAEYRKDCIAFIGLPTRELQYLSVKTGATEEILYTNNLKPIVLHKFDFSKRLSDNEFAYLNNYIDSLNNSQYVHFTVNIKIQYDIFSSKNRLVNVAGDTAGLKAKASLDQPWVVSAGLERGIIRNADKMHLILSKTQINSFYKKGLNITDNNVLTSQKTFIYKPSSFNRINVRSLFNHLEKESVKILNRYIFSENTLNLRQAIGNEIKFYLQNIQINKGISKGKVHVYTKNESIYVDIIVQPTHAAEEIILRITNKGSAINSQIIN